MGLVRCASPSLQNVVPGEQKMALVTCACAFLVRVFISVLPSVCFHTCAVLCVLSYVCSHLCALICVLSYVCSHMCALICVLSYVCSQLCALICVLLCALVCALSCVCCSVLSYVCSHDIVSFSQFHPPHCLGSLAGTILLGLSGCPFQLH